MQNSMVIFTFSVSTGNTFLGKFGPKNENCQFKRKFGTKTNLNYAEFIDDVQFSVFDRKYLRR